jgi:hypothetical protein
MTPPTAMQRSLPAQITPISSIAADFAPARAMVRINLPELTCNTFGRLSSFVLLAHPDGTHCAVTIVRAVITA